MIIFEYNNQIKFYSAKNCYWQKLNRYLLHNIGSRFCLNSIYSSCCCSLALLQKKLRHMLSHFSCDGEIYYKSTHYLVFQSKKLNHYQSSHSSCYSSLLLSTLACLLKRILRNMLSHFSCDREIYYKPTHYFVFQSKKLNHYQSSHSPCYSSLLLSTLPRLLKRILIIFQLCTKKWFVFQHKKIIKN